jgi:hypothetical protein
MFLHHLVKTNSTILLILHSYMMGLASGNFSKVTDRPIIRVWPPFDPEKRRDFQGFNSMLAKDRLEALTTLADIRHSIICNCPKLFHKVNNKKK